MVSKGGGFAFLKGLNCPILGCLTFALSSKYCFLGACGGRLVARGDIYSGIDVLTYHSPSSSPAVGPPSQIAWQHTMMRWLNEFCIWADGEASIARDKGMCINSSYY